MNQYRANVPNFLVDLSMREMREFLGGAIECRDTDGAEYADEFIREVESEFAT